MLMSIPAPGDSFMLSKLQLPHQQWNNLIVAGEG